MSASLREATAADRLALVDLWVEAWSAAMPTIDFEARRAWFVDRLDELGNSGCAVLVVGPDNGKPLGFLTVDPVAGDVDQLAIARDAQRSGLGRLLICAAKVRSPTGLSLSVNVDNAPAVAFYRREGFEIVGEGINPRSGLAVLRMRWRCAAEVTRTTDKSVMSAAGP